MQARPHRPSSAGPARLRRRGRYVAGLRGATFGQRRQTWPATHASATPTPRRGKPEHQRIGYAWLTVQAQGWTLTWYNGQTGVHQHADPRPRGDHHQLSFDAPPPVRGVPQPSPRTVTKPVTDLDHARSGALRRGFAGGRRCRTQGIARQCPIRSWGNCGTRRSATRQTASPGSRWLGGDGRQGGPPRQPSGSRPR